MVRPQQLLNITPSNFFPAAVFLITGAVRVRGVLKKRDGEWVGSTNETFLELLVAAAGNCLMM